MGGYQPRRRPPMGVVSMPNVPPPPVTRTLDSGQVVILRNAAGHVVHVEHGNRDSVHAERVSAPKFVDWGSSTGCEPRTPNVFERLFAEIRDHIVAAYVAVAVTIVVLFGALTDWLVMLACLGSVSVLALVVAIAVGRHHYRQHLRTEWAALAARADEENHRWMTEGNDR